MKEPKAPEPGSASALAAALEEEEYGPRDEAYDDADHVRLLLPGTLQWD